MLNSNTIETKKDRKKNPWCEFIKQHSNEVGKLSQKDKFRVLSEMWKDKKSEVITVSLDYISEMHSIQNKLRNELECAKRTIQELQDRILYLEYNSIDSEE